VIVPPVPTEATNTSSFPSRSRQISSAVVRRWTSGLAGFENWFGTQQSPRSRQMRRASSIASFMPPIDSTQTTSAPYSRSSFSRSRLMPCGIVMTRS
jgi:hypothetical protein